MNAFAFGALQRKRGTMRPDGRMAPNELSGGDHPLVVILGPMHVDNIGVAAESSS
jgi:hypothetical protein